MDSSDVQCEVCVPQDLAGQGFVPCRRLLVATTTIQMQLLNVASSSVEIGKCVDRAVGRNQGSL